MVNLSNLRQNKQDQQGTSGLDSSEVSALSGSGTSVFDTLDSLPNTGLTAGSKALVNDVNRLYISDGSGWYNIDLNTGFTPYWLTEPDATYTIADSQTPLTVTAKALDSDGTTPINQSFGSDSAQYMVSVTNDSSVFTFIPKSADSIGIEVGAGNLTDSNGDFVYTFKWSDGINFVSKAVTISYSPSSGAIIPYGGSRAISAAGRQDGIYLQIDYYSIPTTGDAQDFGDLPRTQRSGGAGASNGTRVVITGGNLNNLSSNVMDEVVYITTSTLGNAQDLCFLNTDRYRHETVSDGTLAITAGGRKGGTSFTTIDEIEKLTIESTSNGTDFGNLSEALYYTGGWSSSTRAVFMGGYTATYDGSSFLTNNIDYVTTATPGNASSFGTISAGKVQETSGVGDDTRAIMMGGRKQGSPNPSQVEEFIQYITIATLGNTQDFGDLLGNYSGMGTGSDGTYACCHAPFNGSAATNIIERITIQTTGNSTDHGDLTVNSSYTAGSAGYAA